MKRKEARRVSYGVVAKLIETELATHVEVDQLELNEMDKARVRNGLIYHAQECKRRTVKRVVKRTGTPRVRRSKKQIVIPPEAPSEIPPEAPSA
jgi:hypothetical protein